MYGVDKDGRDMDESAMSLLHNSPVDGPTLPAFFSPLLEFLWPLFFPRTSFFLDSCQNNKETLGPYLDSMSE